MNTESLQSSTGHAALAENGQDIFLLGGRDLEMDRLSKRVQRSGADVIDLALTQMDASNSGIDNYSDAIEEARELGRTPVAIELAGADKIPGVIDIDHHNSKTDRQASILQVLERLKLEPRLVDRLVAANDTGYIPAMDTLLETEYIPAIREKYGGRVAEERKHNLIDLVRAMDRKKQGVTEEMEMEAEAAVSHTARGPDGLLIIPIKGSNFAPVQDRLYSKGGNHNLVVICNSEHEEKDVWFFGPGDVCEQVASHFRSVKAEKKPQNSDDKPNEYHVVANGAGLGKRDKHALCLVVAKEPQEIIDYIAEVEKHPID